MFFKKEFSLLKYQVVYRYSGNRFEIIGNDSFIESFKGLFHINLFKTIIHSLIKNGLPR